MPFGFHDGFMTNREIRRCIPYAGAHDSCAVEAATPLVSGTTNPWRHIDNRVLIGNSRERVVPRGEKASTFSGQDSFCSKDMKSKQSKQPVLNTGGSFITGQRKLKNGRTRLYLDPDHPITAAFLKLAEDAGVTPDEYMARLIKEERARWQSPPATSEPDPLALMGKRFGEIEKAADLEPGSVLFMLLEVARAWESEDAEPLLDFVLEGWVVTDPVTTERNLRTLHAKWREEDALAAS